MSCFRTFAVALLVFVSLCARAETQAVGKPSEVVFAALERLTTLINAPADKTFTATLRVTKAEGLPKEATDAWVDLAVQAPEHLGAVAHVKGAKYAICRDGQEIWGHLPDKHWGLIGKSGVLRFSEDPKSVDETVLPPLALPVNLQQLQLPLMLMNLERRAMEKLDGVDCDVIEISAPAQAAALITLPAGKLELAIRTTDHFPARVRYADGKVNVEVLVEKPQLVQAWPAENWKIHPQEGDKIETTAVSHLLKCAQVAAKSLNSKIPTLGPATGAKTVVATSGQGRLEMQDGTRVLFLKGTPEEMGKQQGELLKKELRDVTDRILYGVGVGSSFAKGRWFFGRD